MEEARVKNLIETWYQKSCFEQDVFSKFIFLWICFNVVLDYQSKKNSDREMIDWLVGQTKDSSDLIAEFEQAKKTEPFLKSLKALVAMAPIDDSKLVRPSVKIRDVDDRGNIIRALYRIRCNLFHGGKEANNARDQKLVTLAQRILEKWIGNLINSWRI